MQQIQQLAPAWVGQGLEQQVGVVALHHILNASHYLPI
jgi:hypothetical protein